MKPPHDAASCKANGGSLRTSYDELYHVFRMPSCSLGDIDDTETSGTGSGPGQQAEDPFLQRGGNAPNSVGSHCLLVIPNETLIGCGLHKHWWWTSVKVAGYSDCPKEIDFTYNDPEETIIQNESAPTRLQTCGGPATEIMPKAQ